MACATASRIAFLRNDARYLWRVGELATELEDRATLDDVFGRYISAYSDEKARYLALTHYARALSLLEYPGRFNPGGAQE